MKHLKRIVSIFLVICMLFTTTAFGAVKKPGKVEITSVKGGPYGVSIEYKLQNDNNVSYKLYYSENKEYGYKSAAISNTGYVYFRLESNKTYYIKMRAYKKVSGKTYWGKYSDVFKVTTKRPEPSFYSNVNSVYSNILVSPNFHSHDIVIDMNSMFLYDTIDKKIITRLIPKTYIYNEASNSNSTPQQQFVNFEKLKVEDGNYAIIWFTQETQKASLNNNRHAIIYSVDYNDKSYIIKSMADTMEYTEINWKK